MMRLFDRLREKIALDRMPVIDGSSIAQAIDNLPPTEQGMGWSSAMYGIVAPPFATFFVEAQTEGRGAEVWRGSLCSVYDTPLDARAPAGTAWTYTLEPFLYIKHQGLFSYHGAMSLIFVDRAGVLLTDMQGNIPMQYRAAREGLRQLPPAGAPPHCVYALKSISAMHQACAMEHVEPSEGTQQIVRRKTGHEAIDYYVLRVRPTVRGDFAAIGYGHTEEPRRSHVVRGHFKYYHPDRPLFGQAGKHGMIWIPDHRRGDSEVGTIEKDYRVELGS